jgi:DNA-binding transcriptional MocR family regulator
VRLGWVLAPAGLAAAVAAEKEMSDRGSCTLDQVALATLLTSAPALVMGFGVRGRVTRPSAAASHARRRRPGSINRDYNCWVR